MDSMARTEQELISLLSNSSNSLGPQELFEAFNYDKATPTEVELALWNLVEEGKVEFTPDYHLKTK